MIGARGTDGAGNQLLVLGLTWDNLDRLRLGQPAFLTNATHPFIPAGWNVTIIAAQDERTLIAWLKQPDTDVRPYTDPTEGN